MTETQYFFKHAGNIYEQQRVNRRLTILLVTMFVAHYLLLGYLADVSILRIDPLGLILPADGRIPYITLSSCLFAVAYTLFCLYRGDDLVLKSIGYDSLWADYSADPSITRIWWDDQPNHQFVNVVTEICIAAGVPRPALYVVNDPDPNAFVAGRNPSHATMVVTEGLLKNLDREELQAVVAHEIAHIRNYDIRLMTLASTLGGGGILLAASASAMVAGGGARSGVAAAGRFALFAPGYLILLPFWLGLTLFTAITVRILEMLISDERIYQADVTAAELTRNPLGLIRALKNLDSFTGPTRTFSPSIASLCIMGPSGEYQQMDNPSFFFRFCLKAHPPMVKRLEALKILGFLQEPDPAPG